MNNIIIYSKTTCPYCVKAKRLLSDKGLSYTEINVDTNDLREEMIKKSGGRTTVPQIFINGTHIGGYDDLEELEESGELDDMLN